MFRVKSYATLAGSIAFVASLCCNAVAAPAAAPIGGNAGFRKFCNQIVVDFTHPPARPILASSGLMMACFGRQYNNGSGLFSRRPAHLTLVQKALSGSPNVDAANPSEDTSPNGLQNYGQSETSIAAIDNFVVEAWNDSTGFTAACGSPNYKEELTGFGLSTNGGRSFTDLGGLPNPSCKTSRNSGDASVEAYRARNGRDYFYVSNLFLDSAGNASVALDACSINGSIPTCSGPYLVATGQFLNTPAKTTFNFLDKPFATIDPARARLYISYTRFLEVIDNKKFSNSTFGTTIELVGCDLKNPAAPVCSGKPTAGNASRPLAVVNPSNFGALLDPCTGNDQGSYPAVDRLTGDAYVAYQHNTFDVFGCNQRDTHVVARVPFPCIKALSAPSPCSPGSGIIGGSVPIVSMDNAVIPGYNRARANTFPRIAVSNPYRTVSIVWNDARNRPTGDIYLQSFALGATFPRIIQRYPVRISNNTTPTFDFLPALRYAEPSGRLDVTWTDRRLSTEQNRSVTDVYGAFGVNPVASTTPGNVRVTDVSSSWLNTSSDIRPNFGDYTDNYVKQSAAGPSYLAPVDFVAWSDGRIGEPQPFEAYFTGI